jgi:hypothetical protein
VAAAEVVVEGGLGDFVLRVGGGIEEFVVDAGINGGGEDGGGGGLGVEGVGAVGVDGSGEGFALDGGLGLRRGLVDQGEDKGTIAFRWLIASRQLL